MINSLTKQQEDQIQVYIDNALKIGHNTSSIDQDKAIQSVNEIYDLLKMKHPKCIFLESPKACQIEWNKLKKNKKLEFDSEYYNFWYWANYYNFYLFIRNELFPERKNEFALLDKWIEWSKNLHYIQSYNDVCFISNRPEIINKNDKGLNNEMDMAIKYRDGFGLYSLNGNLLDYDSWFKKTIHTKSKLGSVVFNLGKDLTNE